MPPQFHHRRLDNGLTLVAETNPDAHTAAVGFFVKTGGRDEERCVMGVSHFLEHMMFKGTARRSAEAVNREFDEMGAYYNAFTSHENTVYWAQVLPEHLPWAVDLLGDMLRPALRDQDFNVEKNVILEEIGMYEDRPQWRLQDALLEAYFAEHPLSFRVLGTAASIKALNIEQMRQYFRGRYSADNVTVAAAGKLDFDTLVDDVTKIAGAWTPAGATRRYDAPCPAGRRQVLTDARLARHYVAMMCPAPSAQDERRYAAAVLTDVLGDVDGSRLYWALIDPGLADDAEFSHYAQDKVGSYFAFASCDPKRAGQVEEILLKTLDAYASSIDPAEVERAKNKIATGATLRGETPRGRMTNLGSQWVYLGRYLPLEEEIQRLMAVTVDDVRALLAEHPFTPWTIVRLGPK